MSDPVSKLLGSWPVGSYAAVVGNAQGALRSWGAVERSYALASVTKPLFALAVLVAAEEGTLDLDAPLGPPLDVAIGGSTEVTVRHLLSHASGLAPDSATMFAPTATRRIYSNAGFELTGQLLERNSGLDPATYLHEAVVEPLRLRATHLVGSAAHGASSSADDLARLGVELLSPRLIAPETLDEMTSPQWPELSGVLPGYGNQSPNPWGLGVEIKGAKRPHWTSDRNSAATFGHFGRSGTFIWIDPVADRFLVVLTDTDFGPWATAAWPVLADAVLDLS